MKKSINFLIWLLLISCTASKKNAEAFNEANTIVYFMPRSVEELLEAETKKSEKIYFELWNEDSCYRIFLHRYDGKSGNTWISRSRRKLFLNGKFFPIVFDFDRKFGITDDGEEVPLTRRSL